MNIRKYMQIISWHYFDTSRLAAGLFIGFDYLYAMVAAGIVVFLIVIWRSRSDA